MALINKYSKEELEQIVKQSTSLNQVIDKLGYSTHSGSNSKTVKKRLDNLNIDYSNFLNKKVNKYTEDTVFIENSTASQNTLRKWYYEGNYVPYLCSICGQEPFWQDKELTLILDHINGKNHDDRLENLRWVCPNCNQQLETTGYKTFRTENIQHKKYYCKICGKEISRSSTKCSDCAMKERRIIERPSREILKNKIRNVSFSEIGREYGVSDNAIRKWCDSYNLPRKVSDIKKYTDLEWDNL